MRGPRAGGLRLFGVAPLMNDMVAPASEPGVDVAQEARDDGPFCRLQPAVHANHRRTRRRRRAPRCGGHLWMQTLTIWLAGDVISQCIVDSTRAFPKQPVSCEESYP